MPIYELMRLRNICDDETRMSIQLALHGAPIIKGIKMANLITLPSKEIYSIDKILQGTSISYRVLKSGDGKIILYLYREKELKEYIFSADIMDFLQSYGYEGNDVGEMIDMLSDRVMLHKGGETEFPHEIGIFLGYPLIDVKGFLENSGENFSYVGYWKVYHDVQGALRLFRRYDEEREKTVREIMRGKTIREIAV